jgi:Pentapeptide repeats (8 copies)
VSLSKHLSGASLSGATLVKAYLSGANLSGADLNRANLGEADFSGADLSGADLSNANLSRAEPFRAEPLRGNLTRADCTGANLARATLSGANLVEAALCEVNLSSADATRANLSRANLTRAYLIGTNLTGADLTGCRLYDISAWDLKLERTVQKDLIITPHGEPEITVDNLEVAQFIYLLLNNERVRHVVDTITSKVVLILGRFTPKRKVVLDALREELRRHDYLPVLFDFDKPASRDLTGTVQTLANMARFIIADLTGRRVRRTSLLSWSRLPWSPSSRSF